MRKLLLCALIGVSLTGCTDPVSEATNQLELVRQEATSAIEQPPALDESKPIRYSPNSQRSPFVSMMDYERIKYYKPVYVTVNENRVKTKLEQFSLESINLNGIISKSGKISIVATDPDGEIHVLSVGSYIGQDNGRVSKITKNFAVVSEAISDGMGKYIQRNKEIQFVRDTDESE